jgi:hypothetical protein
MSRWIRRSVALLASALIFSTVCTAAAHADTFGQSEAANASPAVDALVLRPAGFVSLVLGTGLFVLTSPFVLLTRPHEIGKPFDQFVMEPARYLWVDPLGGH